jgi:predicted GH43/DUF377 family glycosyl hydrolase
MADPTERGGMGTRTVLLLVLVLAAAGNLAAQTQWVVYEGNPVIPRPEADSWPGLYRWVEAVVVVDGTYHMFFTGTQTAFWVDHTIGHATSRDGISWTIDPNNPVMTPAAEGEWNVSLFASLAVIHDGTEFQMWYGGVDEAGFCQIGLASSPDGSTWTRYAGNPVIENGPAGSIDSGLVYPGSVLLHGGLHHMWYSACNEPTVSGKGWIGYATSPDGVSWTRHSSPVLETGSRENWDRSVIYGPGVVFDGISYHMWYTGVVIASGFWATIQIGHATSPDGITWTKDPDNPIDELGEFKAQPRVLLHAKARLCEMFYNGENVDDCSVNRATSSCRMYSQPRRPVTRRAPLP